MTKGWRYESGRHGLAARGIKSGSKSHHTSRVRKVPVYQVELIAGRGSPGSMNWGYADPDEAQINKWMVDLKKEVGKKVLLSGGGGFGINSAILKEVWKEGDGLRVRLSNLNPPELSGGKDFTPWIGSWQISRLKKVGMEPEKNKNIEGHFYSLYG